MTLFRLTRQLGGAAVAALLAAQPALAVNLQFFFPIAVGGAAADTIKALTDEYMAARGWEVETLLSEEHGVLPVVAGGDFAGFWRDGGDAAARAGSRAALFHSLTSYSVPDAVRFALALAHHDALDGDGLKAFSAKWAKGHWENQSYYRMLSALLFGGAYPEERLHVLERFYTLDPQLIERFYSGRSTLFDKFRILAGVPPIPIPRALGTITGLGRQPAPLKFSGV